MHAVRDLRVLLRLRDFRSLLAARLLSQAADGVFQVALAAFVVFSPEKQTSPAAIASAMAILLLPYSLLGPFTGYCSTAGGGVRSCCTAICCARCWRWRRRR